DRYIKVIPGPHASRGRLLLCPDAENVHGKAGLRPIFWRTIMLRRPILAACFAAATFGMIAASVSDAAPAAAPTVQRKVLLQQDLQVPNNQIVLVEVMIPVGGREGRHTHPGAAVVYVQEGALTLDYEGMPTKTYNVGESFYIETGKIHE